MPHPIYNIDSVHYIAPSLNEVGVETTESYEYRENARREYDHNVHIDDYNYSTQEVTAEQLTNYADEPITCNECGMRCTRPTAKTIRTKTCKKCRRSIRNNEAIKTLPTEKGIDLMEDKKETVIIKQAKPKKGILQKMRIQRTSEGVQLIYESPIMQNFFKTWFYNEQYPEKDNKFTWQSNIFPEGHAQRVYFGLKDLPKQYQTLLYFQWASTQLVLNGKPNLAFLQAVNDFPTTDKGEPLSKSGSELAFKADKTMSYMNPTKPIVITLKGLFPNKTLDDFMMRTKEIMYQIYADNLMPFDKSVIISMESKDETANTK